MVFLIRLKNCWSLGTIENDLKREERGWRVVGLKLKLEVMSVMSRCRE